VFAEELFRWQGWPVADDAAAADAADAFARSHTKTCFS
jgi:hypothetical protein